MRSNVRAGYPGPRPGKGDAQLAAAGTEQQQSAAAAPLYRRRRGVGPGSGCDRAGCGAVAKKRRMAAICCTKAKTSV